VTEPANIREFNEITGVIFAQLYAAFPDLTDINADRVAQALGHSRQDQLESGRTFAAMLSLTAGWLASEGFIHPFGDHALSRVCLTAKALAAMNVTLEKLSGSLGSQITDTVKEGPSEAGKRRLAELVGSLLGSFAGSVTKALGSG
jgi:hypothetical protein